MSSTAQRLIEAGHKPKVDEDGDIDIFAIESEYHNGPMCTVCYAGRCQHCDDGSPFPPCPGQDEMDRRAKEARCKQYEALKEEFGDEER